MVQALNDEQLIESYLLGQLSEEEAARLEERGLADYDFFERMLVVEDRLIDDFLAGQLAPQACAQFEHHFLASPKRRERVELTAALLKSVSQPLTPTLISAPAADKQSAVADKLTWLNRWQNFFGLNMLAYGMTAAALLLLAFAGWSFMETRQTRKELAQLSRERTAAQQREQELQARLDAQQGQNEELRQELERNHAELERLKAEEAKLQQPRSPTTVIASLVLTPPVLRGNSPAQVPQLTIQPGTATARLTLVVDKELIASFPNVRAELSRGGKIEWSQTGLQPRGIKAGRAFIIMLPAASLSGGSYMIRLVGSGAVGETVIADYPFKIEKK